MKILLVGNGAREHVIATSFKKNPEVQLCVYMSANNPGLAACADDYKVGPYSEVSAVVEYAKEQAVDFAFIGPEDPLGRGTVDGLGSAGIAAIGPTQQLAQLETSKSFTRDLLANHNIEGNPQYKVFTRDDQHELDAFMDTLPGIVIKPDGLTGGKGVQVQGDHFQTKQEAIAYCEEVLETHQSVIVEEKLDGEEFSLHCFSDGSSVAVCPLAQDHKRAFDNDQGPNTGGMGSYSCSDGLLPFISEQDKEQAVEITKQVQVALEKECGQPYIGIMYGGFIKTKTGVKLIEYNARFGDPEAMNIFSVLKTDLATICKAMIDRTLKNIEIEFEPQATVCIYVVPKGYPTNPVKNEKVQLGAIPDGVAPYYASVNQKDDGLYMSGSRAIAFVAQADSVSAAAQKAQEAVGTVSGNVFFRTDIGSDDLIQKRINHMKHLLND